MFQPTQNTWASQGSATRTKDPLSLLLAPYLSPQPPLQPPPLQPPIPTTADAASPASSVVTEVTQVAAKKQKVLELASGFGEHLAYFGPRFPNCIFQPTEAQPELLDLQTFIPAREGIENILVPLKLNILDPNDWSLLSSSSSERGGEGGGGGGGGGGGEGGAKQENQNQNQGGKKWDTILAFNIIHISVPETTNALFKYTFPLLRSNGTIILYGAYRRNHTFASPGDAAFDADLKRRDSRFGLRDLESVCEIAKGVGYVFVEVREMEKGNLFVVWRKP